MDLEVLIYMAFVIFINIVVFICRAFAVFGPHLDVGGMSPPPELSYSSGGGGIPPA